VVGLEEGRPLCGARLDDPGLDPVHVEAGALERLEVVLEGAHREEEPAPQRCIALVADAAPVRSPAPVGAHELLHGSVDRVDGLVDDPRPVGHVDDADVARLDVDAPIRPQQRAPRAQSLVEVVVEVDRVGGGDHVDAALEQGRLERLLERLQAALVAQEVEQPERDPLVGAELLDGDAEELRRGVHDQDPRVGGQRGQEPLGEDAGAAGVVEQDPARRKPRAERLDRPVEVPVPAVLPHGVVLARQLLRRARHPVVAGNAREAGRPDAVGSCFRALGHVLMLPGGI